MNERAEEISPPMKPSSWILPQINKLNEKSTKSTLQCSHGFSTQRDLCVLSQQKTIQQNSDRNWGHLLQIHQVPHLGDGEISQVVLLMSSELRHPPVEGYGRHEIPLFPKVFYTFQVVGLGFLNHQQYQLERIPLRSQLPIGLGLPVAQKQLATPRIGSGDRHLKPITVYYLRYL